MPPLILQQDETEIGLGGNNQLLTLGIGLLVTAVAATYVTRLAKVIKLLGCIYNSGNQLLSCVISFCHPQLLLLTASRFPGCCKGY